MSILLLVFNLQSMFDRCRSFCQSTVPSNVSYLPPPQRMSPLSSLTSIVGRWNSRGRNIQMACHFYHLIQQPKSTHTILSIGRLAYARRRTSLGHLSRRKDRIWQRCQEIPAMFTTQRLPYDAFGFCDDQLSMQRCHYRGPVLWSCPPIWNPEQWQRFTTSQMGNFLCVMMEQKFVVGKSSRQFDRRQTTYRNNSFKSENERKCCDQLGFWWTGLLLLLLLQMEQKMPMNKDILKVGKYHTLHLWLLYCCCTSQNEKQLLVYAAEWL